MLLLLGSLSALGPSSMDGYVPALPSIASDFGVGTSLAQVSVAVYLIGLGSGQLISGPCSDVFGRRRPMLTAIVAYTAASVGCALAPSIAVLIGFRFLQGLSASAGVVISRAIVRDLYSGREAARFLSRMVMIYGVAPMLAPVVGGGVLVVTDWRGIFWLLALLAVALLALTARKLPETLPPERRMVGGMQPTLAALGVLIRDRSFVGYAIALGCATGSVVAYVSASSFVMENIFGLSPQVYALFFGAGAAMMIATSQLNVQLLHRFEPRSVLDLGGLLLVGIAIVLFVAVKAELGIWVVGPSMIAVMGCWGLIPANAISLALLDHRDIAGSASAILGVFQYGLAAIATPLVGSGGGADALPMAVVILALSLFSIAAVNLMTAGRRSVRRRSV